VKACIHLFPAYVRRHVSRPGRRPVCSIGIAVPVSVPRVVGSASRIRSRFTVVADGIVNLTDFACFVPVSGRRGLRIFNGLEASAMHSNCSNLLKLTVPPGHPAEPVRPEPGRQPSDPWRGDPDRPDSAGPPASRPAQRAGPPTKPGPFIKALRRTAPAELNAC
jgi:hypothetical protein